MSAPEGVVPGTGRDGPTHLLPRATTPSSPGSSAPQKAAAGSGHSFSSEAWLLDGGSAEEEFPQVAGGKLILVFGPGQALTTVMFYKVLDCAFHHKAINAAGPKQGRPKVWLRGSQCQHIVVPLKVV